ncbi:MAG TPA: HutD family protein [Planctomycetota bacterium]|nr:HutD family protein [Planctomycetota bacterium]
MPPPTFSPGLGGRGLLRVATTTVKGAFQPGPVVDFNVMADRTFARTHVAVQDLAPGQDRPDEQADHILVHVIRGKIVRASIHGVSSVELTASDSILFATTTRGDGDGVYQATEVTSLLIAQIWRLGD